MTASAPQSPRPHRLAGRVVATAVIGVLALVAVGCSSSSDDAGTPKAPPAPESVFAPDSEVTAGLANLKTIFASAASTTAAKGSTAAFPDQLEDQWSQIEGTVKKNEPLLYTQVEDALSQIDNAMKDGRPSEANAASTSYSSTADAYLAKHP